MPDARTATLTAYIEAILRLQREQQSFTDEELREIAIETGMSDEDVALARKRAGEHLNRGKGFLKYENWNEAVRELEEAVVLAPSSVDALSALATAHWRRDDGEVDRQRARAYAMRALALDSTNDAALHLVSTIDRGDSPSAGTTASGANGGGSRRSPVAAVLAALALVGAAVFFIIGQDDSPQPQAQTEPDHAVPATPTPPAPPPTPEPPVEKSRGFAALVQTIGQEGIGAGMMEDSRTIAIGADGRMYVGEYSDGRVQVFDSAGAFVTMFSIGKNRYLKSMAVDRDGTLYMVYRGEIHRYASDGTEKGTLRYSGGPGFEEVSVTPDGGLIASWNGHFRGGLLINPESLDAIVRFDRNGRTVRTLKRAVSKQTESFESDVEVVEDGLGTIFTLSEGSREVLRFKPGGAFVDRDDCGADGKFPGRPEGIEVDGQGRVLVLDGGSIRRFDSNGRLLDELELKSHASDFALGVRGEIVTVARTKIERYR